MEDLKINLENFERITNWLGDILNKYNEKERPIYKNGMKFQKAFENPQILMKLVAKACHMPKRFRKVFAVLPKKEKIEFINILQQAEIMVEEQCIVLISFINFYYSGKNYVEHNLRHYEAALFAFKTFDFGDLDRQSFIVQLYTDTQFYYYQVFYELGITDENLLDSLTILKNKKELFNFITTSSIPVTENFPTILSSIENYGLEGEGKTLDSDMEQFGYFDKDSIRREEESEWN